MDGKYDRVHPALSVLQDDDSAPSSALDLTTYICVRNYQAAELLGPEGGGVRGI